MLFRSHPAAKAVEIFLAAKMVGKFQGLNAATTPTGSYLTDILVVSNLLSMI